MQFKGTPTFPTSVLDKGIAREGGVWNAFTHMDWTTYYEVMPADKIDLALELEADRMANSLFTETDVESERTVIISERQGSENEPTFRLAEEIQAAAFRVHPYHHDIVGDMADRVAVMYLGKIMELADRDELYANPMHPYTQALLSAVPIPDPVIEEKRKRIILEGDVPSPANPPKGCNFCTRCPKAMDVCREQEPVFKDYGSGHYTACWLYPQ